MRGYSCLGKNKLNHKNLSLYLLKKKNKGTISFYQEKQIYNESGKNIKTIWDIDGESMIEYNKKNKKWTVKFIDEPPINIKVIDQLPIGQSFRDRKFNYKYNMCGFKLMNKEEDFNYVDSDFYVILSSKNIKKVIKFPLFFGFRFKQTEI